MYKRLSVDEEISERLKAHPDTKITPETLDKLKKLLVQIDEILPPKQSVGLKPSRGKCTVFDSKLGGVPYFPKEMEYPTVRDGIFAGKQLRLLAQLNFGKLPKIEDFPTEGILQFFAGCEEHDVYGADFDDQFDQNCFRVIYHENVITDESKLLSENDMPDLGDFSDYPFKGEFLLTPEAHYDAVSQNDFRFDAAVTEAYNKLFGGNVTGMWGSGGSGICQVDEPLY